jgi:hypothetical protein
MDAVAPLEALKGLADASLAATHIVADTAAPPDS